MKNRNTILLVTLAFLLSSPASSAGQALKKRPTTSAPSRIEPLRVVGGQLHASTITGHVKRGWSPSTFSFTLTKAEIVGDRLRLAGDFTLHGAQSKTSDHVTATIGGVMSNAANPWPNARQERRSDDAKKSNEVEEKKTGEQQQGREAKNPETSAQLGQLAQSTQDTARKTPPAPGQKPEQTKSLYAESETSNRCSVIFLKLTLPPRLRARLGATTEPLQLGVVLKPFDNERGEEILNQVCLLLQTSNQPANLDRLNRLLSLSK